MTARLGAAFMSVAALLAVGLMVSPPGGLRWQAQPGSACDDLRTLSDSWDLSSLADQAVIRAHAVQLAAALRAGDGPGAGAQLSDATRAQVLTELQVVLADPAATTGDLVEALGPLSAGCGMRFTR